MAELVAPADADPVAHRPGPAARPRERPRTSSSRPGSRSCATADSIADPQAVLAVADRHRQARVVAGGQAHRSGRAEGLRRRRRRHARRANCPKSGCSQSDTDSAAVAARRATARTLPGPAARDRLRRQARLRPPRRVARHAGGQHRPHPGPVPRQAARPARRRPRTGRDSCDGRRARRRERPSTRWPPGPLDETDKDNLLREVAAASPATWTRCPTTSSSASSSRHGPGECSPRSRRSPPNG